MTVKPQMKEKKSDNIARITQEPAQEKKPAQEKSQPISKVK